MGRRGNVDCLHDVSSWLFYMRFWGTTSLQQPLQQREKERVQNLDTCGIKPQVNDVHGQHWTLST